MSHKLTKSLRDLVLINNDENIMRATREDESTSDNIAIDFGGPIDPTKVCFNPNYSHSIIERNQSLQSNVLRSWSW